MNMGFKVLQKKYQQLLLENNRLKEEIKRLKAQPGLELTHSQNSEGFTQSEALTDHITKRSGSDEKVRLFMSLFRGRDDVYAKRWENKPARQQ